MHDAPVISVQNVSKAYRIWATPAQRLISPACAQLGDMLPGAFGTILRHRAQAGYRDFFALQDVSFEVKRGEAVGIIGRNGSGKSTLLQIIAGTLQPTAGTARVQGRVAALLELGAGFNPDFTGRENVMLSGAVLGLSRAEMEARFDEVAAFADIGEFIEQPVKTYSSGMMMRLAFAVNTCVDPEVLIVDEALSVGDAPFQAKCFRRLRQLIDQGVSLLFVSHDIGTVRSICSRALWLKNGRAEMWGEAKPVAKEYEKFCWAEQGVTVASTTAEETNAVAIPTTTHEPTPATAALVRAHNHLLPNPAADTRLGNQQVEFLSVVATGSDGQPRLEFDYDDEITLHYLLRARAAVNSDFVIGVRLRDVQGNHVLSAQNLRRLERLVLPAGGEAYVQVAFRAPVTHGHYIVRTGVFGFRNGTAHELGRYDFSRAIFWDIREDALALQVRPYAPMPLAGPVHLHASMKLFSLSSIHSP